ncbi:SMAD/FHA domain-containing protein [Coniochaeta ligniaria NRRL 30616]|uniref:SMAD/FHA domain-containing protein n=1 Tax=Coniochaeta ligniaria NRRL 30616 TaxID=1408157 RepID=A0A1J7IZF4_9PEZI|nr:SMAD/FHA domain-containing protein [Coniochaeta ligniaria NRRL 30616]
MGSDASDGDYRSRRRKHEDDEEVSSSRKRRHRDDEDADKPRRRERPRSRSRERKPRDRSRSPDSSRRRSRERRKDRDSEGTRDRHKHRSRSKDNDREASKEKDTSRRHRHRHRHHRSPSPQKAIDYASARQTSDSRRERHHRDSPSAKAPNFKPTGVLAAAANAVTVGTGETVTLKYHEPPEARKPPPRDKWKLFVFKGEAVVDTIELSLRSCWLVGRDRGVVDLPAEHPSVSKQHAVVQFRFVEKRNEFGDRVGKVKPYLIDLESANGTVLNGDKVPESRYLELRDRDVVKFGLSEREYVVMLDRE